MTAPLRRVDFTRIQTADVYKAGVLAATLMRTTDGVRFAYSPDYLSRAGTPVAASLPLTDNAFTTSGGAVPPFFAGLLPEGRRLSGLRRAIKTSADDELSLLLAIGADVVGDVVIVPKDNVPAEVPALITVQKSWSEVRFTELLTDAAIIDPIGIPGVQDKASARMISAPVREGLGKYILKISPPEYPGVVENEALFLDIARRSGLPTAQARIVYDSDGRSGLLVRRFDRDSSPPSGALACEDACQLLGRWPADKYAMNAETIAHALSERCASRVVALRDVFRQLCFAWLTGNGDLHAKNLSVIQAVDGEWRIAPAYDIPNTTVYGDTSFAVVLDGKRNGLSRKRFLSFAAHIGLREQAAVLVIDTLLEKTVDIADRVRAAQLPLPEKVVTDLIAEMRNRRRLLSTH